VVAKCLEEGLKVIIVHGSYCLGVALHTRNVVQGALDLPTGAGSFGHPQAKKYQINGGWSQYNLQDADSRKAFELVRYGFAATR
jgi:hypothetical protein